MLAVWSNDWAACHTEICKTQRMTAVTVCSLKSDELQFVNIFSANKVAILCSVDLVYYVR